MIKCARYNRGAGAFVYYQLWLHTCHRALFYNFWVQVGQAALLTFISESWIPRWKLKKLLGQQETA
jgi:hypothetical protein